MIKCACVKYRELGSVDTYKYMEGNSHTNCYDALVMIDIYARVRPEKYDVIEGFMCTDNRFVDRVEAMKIARKHDLLKDSYKNTDSPILYSYMVNYVRD